MGGNGNFDAPRDAVHYDDTRGRGREGSGDGDGAGDGSRVHLSAEEWTRLALRAVAVRDDGTGGAAPNRRAAASPVVWELLPGRIVLGCEDRSPGVSGPGGSEGTGRVLRLDELALISAGDSQPGEPPDAGLVTTEVQPGRRVLVDLLAARVTTLAGRVADRDAYLCQLAAELAERRWAPLRRVVLVGLPQLAAFVPCRARSHFVDGISDVERLLDDPPEPPTPTGRVAWPRMPRAGAPSDGATIVVVGASATADVARLDQLVSRVGGRAGGGETSASSHDLALLVAAPWPGARCYIAVAEGGRRGDVFLRATPGRAGPLRDLAPLAVPGRERAPRDVHAQTAAEEQVTAPVDVDAPPISPAPARAQGPDQRPSRPPPPPDPAGEPAAVEVAVLGRVEIRGVEGSLARRPKLTELVVYLALHPGGATTATWSTALWPRRRVPPQTVANRLSEARRLLGFASDDRPRLRRVGDAHVLAEVSTDWDRFASLAGRPDRDSWRAALALVRGRPFEDLPPGLWTAIECTAVEIERAVTECALRCGESLLESGDPDGAAWAAHQGLRAAPWDERLHRLLMVTADATGNRAGVDATLRHLALVLEIEGDPLRHVHPETAALYEQLGGRPAGTAR